MPGVRGFMPPQGLLVIAAYLPAAWQVRFIDENIAPGHAPTISPGPTRCSSAACTCSGRSSTTSTRAPTAPASRRCWAARRCPACPEHYPDVDYLHVGELGDATDAIIAYIDDQPVRPPRQMVFRTEERVALDASRAGL